MFVAQGNYLSILFGAAFGALFFGDDLGLGSVIGGFGVATALFLPESAAADGRQIIRKGAKCKRLYLVDSFTNDMFRGNPAGVLPDAADLSNDLRQSIARELNASETAFLEERDDAWSLRWHSPRSRGEVLRARNPRCGSRASHRAGAYTSLSCSTPASARSLSNGRTMPIRSFFHASIRSRRTRQSRLCWTSSPVVIRCSSRTSRTSSFGLKSQRDVERLQGQTSQGLSAFSRRGVCVTAKGDGEVDFVSRYFAPGAGIPEDPVTGSTHATPRALLGRRSSARPISWHGQASQRGGGGGGDARLQGPAGARPYFQGKP